ncbi:NAD(P)H-binding protein [Conexibacter sp. JD483]|uniref:NAD(P)H-binding protein n=1 Tax=unclassified Conexibacter TaxID=2627773 RepID=UPI0027272745|nr:MULTISPECIES: NAD(P)H-binding protein [unclassified Conexibacter]MDO8189169.1 NAD(P)H-binding protein [Conexibacter sp. CPCC 205706]MDO8201945.1 NAD(P)H-binding protein [Conexibacter sp. CPCC 205762]MDR9372387.1 NAD(P)H-binding protein [Conexibacter sp. JD483]
MTTLAIAGASGSLGRRTAELALERGVAPADLVLVTRDPDKLAEFAARGAQVRAGDFDQPQTLAEAFAGVERLLLISTDAVGRRVAQHSAAIDAAKAAGVKHVAYTSLPAPTEDHPTGPLAADHLGTEEALKASGLDWTFLRNSLYTDLQLASGAHAVASGQLVTNAGAGKIAYVTREDCAAAAAGWLADGGHVGEALDVTGPALVTQAELAAALSAASGQPVAVVDVDDAAFAEGLVAGGVPAPLASVFAGFGTAIRTGLLETRTDVVEQLSGRAPTSVADFLAAHADALTSAPA